MSTAHLPTLAQSGITDRPAEHLVLVALDLVAADPAGCHAAMERLRTVVQAELHGHPADPTVETGELGYDDPHKEYDLMVTMALSDSGYTKLGATAANRPLDLHLMPADVLDASGQGRGAHIAGEGDVLLKITANDIYVTEHVAHRVEHELSGDFTLRWAQTGAQRYNTNQPLSRTESRALIGFLDGTNNLHPDIADDRGLIFTDHTRTDYPPNPPSGAYQGATFPDLRAVPTGTEPAELDGGSYLAVETLLASTGAFDQQSVDAQSAIIGRQKIDGTMISPPDPASHVQKANPHRPGTDDDAETAAAPHGVDVSVAVRWGQQLGHALDRVHAGGLVHRDVKPANAFLRDGDVLLGDLGRAALLNPAGVAGREGTWCTTAPETAPDDGVCSRASDVYSLAATVFYLLSGEYPVDDSLSDLKRQALITAGRRRRLRDLAPHVSRGLAMVIEKSLSTNPTHRHQSALDFGNALVGAGVHERAWRRVSHPGHQHCLRGGAAATVKPVTVCAVASGPRVTVMARLDSGRRPPGWMDREGRLAKLAQLLRAATESL